MARSTVNKYSLCYVCRDISISSAKKNKAKIAGIKTLADQDFLSGVDHIVSRNRKNSFGSGISADAQFSRDIRRLL